MSSLTDYCFATVTSGPFPKETAGLFAFRCNNNLKP